MPANRYDCAVFRDERVQARLAFHSQSAGAPEELDDQAREPHGQPIDEPAAGSQSSLRFCANGPRDHVCCSDWESKHERRAMRGVRMMVPEKRFELPTRALRMRCSTS